MFAGACVHVCKCTHGGGGGVETSASRCLMRESRMRVVLYICTCYDNNTVHLTMWYAVAPCKPLNTYFI